MMPQANTQSSYRSPQHASPRGFTLIELLLVLALLIIVAAIALPRLTGVLESQRLKSGSDMIRAEWGKARVKAMKTGQVYVFEFELAGNRFHVVPIDAGFSAFSNPAFAGSAVAASVPVSITDSDYDELPDRVTFRDHLNETDSRENSVSDASPIAAAGGVRRIYFYPDGTTSTTRVRIANERGKCLDIDLRGLTGVAEVSEILSIGQI